MRYQFFSRNPSILMLEIAASAQFSSMPWMDSRGRIPSVFVAERICYRAGITCVFLRVSGMF